MSLKILDVIIVYVFSPIPAYIAQKRGRNFSTWLALGLVTGIIAFIAALFLKKPTRICKNCGAITNPNATICSSCHSTIGAITVDEKRRQKSALRNDSFLAFAKGSAVVLAIVGVSLGLIMLAPPKPDYSTTPNSSASDNALDASAPITQKTNSTVTAIGPFDSNAYCRKITNKAGSSYQLEKTCRDHEKISKQHLANMEIDPRTAKYCSGIGSTNGGSYQIAEDCIEMERRSKAEIN